METRTADTRSADTRSADTGSTDTRTVDTKSMLATALNVILPLSLQRCPRYLYHHLGTHL